ncbi:hypothetical protein [Microbulbifer hainanensis]|uniref:hypothetical protein n=1 Tax=Microbulbifer hainanensis TaxID=2735675 RepID=UPI0018667A0A|nr:hypothetical protein [Microbulbifer hainanensis]
MRFVFSIFLFFFCSGVCFAEPGDALSVVVKDLLRESADPSSDAHGMALEDLEAAIRKGANLQALLHFGDLDVVKVRVRAEDIGWPISYTLLTSGQRSHILFKTDFEPYDPKMKDNVGEFYIRTGEFGNIKICVDFNDDSIWHTKRDSVDLKCVEYDAEATPLNAKDGFYVFGFMWDSKGGFRGHDSVLVDMQDRIKYQPGQSATCVLYEDRRINNITAVEDRAEPFIPYKATDCIGSVGVMAGPFASVDALNGSVDDPGSGLVGWGSYRIVYCGQGECTQDYEQYQQNK